MSETKPGSAVLETIRGDLYWPESQEYEQARVVFNAMFDRRPALIVRCAAPSDVACALAYAREAGLEVTVYGGGHGVTASAVVDNAVCIDLRGMRRIEVDPQARIARVDAGCTWAELDAATQQHGLAVTGGRVGSTGVVGLALGSGSGWLERSLGFTCDNLLAAELVTVDGRQVTASAEVNPELFWGIRGGGGNFGVVTQLTLQLHPVGPLVLGGMLMYPADQAFDVVSNWSHFMQDAPDEVNGCVAFITAPPLDFVPEALRGRPVVGVVVCYPGDVEEGRRAFAPVLDFGTPAVNMVQPMPYLAVQSLIEGGNPHGMRNYWSADLYGDLPEDAIRTLCEHATQPVSPLSQVIVAAGGGAIARTPEDATAFGNRSSKYNIHYLSMWPDPDGDIRNVEFTRMILAAMKPWSTGGVYLNWIGNEGGTRVQAAFSPEKWQRLRALKKAWDPDNVLRHNQNIPPA